MNHINNDILLPKKPKNKHINRAIKYSCFFFCNYSLNSKQKTTQKCYFQLLFSLLYSKIYITCIYYILGKWPDAVMSVNKKKINTPKKIRKILL